MSLKSQSIPSLTGGVSQQPPASRHPSQVSEQINILAHPTLGAMTRPPSVRQTQVPGPASGSVFLHTVNRSLADRFRVIAGNGTLAVVDAATGAQATVLTPDGLSYLTTTEPERDLRAVTVGDNTYIVNRGTLVRRGSTKSAPQRNEALLSIRQADFATFYGVTINGATIRVTTPDGSTPHERGLISTQYIAEQIHDAIVSAASFTGFVVTQYGSTLHIIRADGADFAISASDGLADQGILAIKGTVQRFSDLPDRAKKGFTVEITGDPDNKFDNYYVTYDDNGAPNLAGVWRESVRPDILVDLDASTMPHLLSLNGAVLDDIEAKGIPDSPTIGSESATPTFDGWDTGPDPLFPAHSKSVQVTLNEQDEGFSVSLAALNDTPATISTFYDVSTSSITPGTFVTVELWVSNMPSTSPLPKSDYTRVASKVYQAGTSLYNEVLQYTANLPADTRVRMALMYSTGVTPSNNRNVASIHLHTIDQDVKSIQVETLLGSTLTFDPTQDYPEGAEYDVTAGADSYTYTLSADTDGATVAAAIAALFVGTTTAAITSPGVILFTTGSGVPTVSCSVTFDQTTRFYNPDIAMASGTLAGKIIENLSDGCQGTITSNTATEIVVASLTGGANNSFQRGDICRVVGAGIAFTFSQAPWKPRLAGDIDSNPYPSFVGQFISDVFYHKNRLGFVAGQGVVLSGALDPYNFFRGTVTQLLPNDLIDVQSASGKTNRFHSAIEWDGRAILWSDEVQTSIIGEPALSPQSVGLKKVSEFQNEPTVKPVVSGRHVFFVRKRGNSTQVFEYAIVNNSGTEDADEATQHIPTYIKGNPLQMVCDASHGFLALRTDDAANVLYVQNYLFDQQNKLQEAWGKWVFNPASEIVGMDMLDGTLVLIMRRGSDLYVETLDLVVSVSDVAGVYRDSRQGTVGAFTGDLYEARMDLSTIFYRALQRFGSIVATTSGRLGLRYALLHHHDSRSFTVSVTPSGGIAKEYVYSNPAGGDDEDFRFPVMARNTEVAISIGNTSPDGFRVSSLDWEGTYTTRSLRV